MTSSQTCTLAGCQPWICAFHRWGPEGPVLALGRQGCWGTRRFQWEGAKLGLWFPGLTLLGSLVQEPAPRAPPTRILTRLQGVFPLRAKAHLPELPALASAAPPHPSQASLSASLPCSGGGGGGGSLPCLTFLVGGSLPSLPDIPLAPAATPDVSEA